MITGSVSVDVNLTEPGVGVETFSIPVPLLTGIRVTTQAILVNGNNSIVIPAGASFCLFYFPSGSGVGKTVKGANGDLGLGLNPAGVNLLSFLQPQTGLSTIVITCVGSDTQASTFIFR